MTDKYKQLRDALASLAAETERNGSIPWFPADMPLHQEETGEFESEMVPLPETDMRFIAAANPNTIRALLADHDEAQARALHETLVAKAAMERVAELEAERDGWLDQHHRDIAILREYAQHRDELRKERDALLKGHDVRLVKIDALITERKALEAECIEQARLNGMGSEREARLIAERDAMSRAAEILADWCEHECGAELELTPGLADIRAILAQHQGEKHGEHKP